MINIGNRARQWKAVGKVVMFVVSAGLAVAIVQFVVFIVTRD